MPAGEGEISIEDRFRGCLLGLAIEWLKPGDARTGLILVKHLLESRINSVYATCETSDGFRGILRETLEKIPERGIPAVHIETHGQKPPADLEADVVFGSGVGSPLTWSDLGEILAPLNQASDFQLMLVGAACYGGATMGAMNACSHVAPFSLCIGYETEVLDESVIRSMTELYSGLLVRRENPHAVIARAGGAAARREVSLPHFGDSGVSGLSLVLG